ncbi:hypothetical protein JTS97_09415 [Clostridium botulinum]|nr:hypothetical protein [Clostridium botulinum]
MEECNLKYGDGYKKILFKPSYNVDILDKNFYQRKRRGSYKKGSFKSYRI